MILPAMGIVSEILPVFARKPIFGYKAVAISTAGIAGRIMLRRVYAQPMEQMVALGSFCAGGVLARHPKLRVAFLEANCSWLPWLLWRLDEGWEREGDVWAPDVKRPPSEYFKGQCVVSVEPDEATITHDLLPPFMPSRDPKPFRFG